MNLASKLDFSQFKLLNLYSKNRYFIWIDIFQHNRPCIEFDNSLAYTINSYWFGYQNGTNILIQCEFSFMSSHALILLLSIHHQDTRNLPLFYCITSSNIIISYQMDTNKSIGYVEWLVHFPLKLITFKLKKIHDLHQINSFHSINRMKPYITLYGKQSKPSLC